jgi:hypothetical protein
MQRPSLRVLRAGLMLLLVVALQDSHGAQQRQVGSAQEQAPASAHWRTLLLQE